MSHLGGRESPGNPGAQKRSETIPNKQNEEKVRGSNLTSTPARIKDLRFVHTPSYTVYVIPRAQHGSAQNKACRTCLISPSVE